MAKEEKITFFTPIVNFIYPKLNTPDVYTPKKGAAGKPKYKTDFDFADPKQTAALKASLNKVAKKLMPKVKEPKMPWKDKDGATVFTCSTGVPEKINGELTGKIIRPAIFDAKNQAVPVTVIIGGGTKGRLKLTVGLYPNEDGLTLYIDQIQIHDLVEGGNKSSSFDVAEGFSYKGADGSEFEPEAGEDDAEGEKSEGGDDYAF